MKKLYLRTIGSILIGLAFLFLAFGSEESLSSLAFPKSETSADTLADKSTTISPQSEPKIKKCLDEDDIFTNIEESLDHDPENYDDCIKIIFENQDILKERDLDIALAKAVMKKITDMNIKYNLDGSNVKIIGPLQKCIVVNSAIISFKEYETSISERDLLDIWKSSVYPLIEIYIKCRVIERVNGDLYSSIIKNEVSVNGFGKSYGFGKFQLKKNDIEDYIGPNTYYEIDKDKVRYIKLRYKLWDDDSKVSDRTRKIFDVLNALKNSSSLNIKFDLYELDKNTGGEAVYTGPRGGRYVIRNSKKQYIKQ